nr:transposase [uncultured Desulfobacter sp.]
MFSQFIRNIKAVLTTNTNLSPEQVPLKYKELWRVERVFRDVKSLLNTRPVYTRKMRILPVMYFAVFLLFCLQSKL